MRLSTYKIFIFSFFILLNYSLSQDECEDIGGFGGALTCEFILDGGVPCDGAFNGVPMTEICPVSCDACLDEDGSGITDGCDLPENTFYLTSDGSVLYNSTDAIGGFQFSVDGVNSVVSASGGDATDSGFTVSAGNTNVLAFSFSGSTIAAGCGTLVDLELDGTATGLSGIIVSDSIGGSLDFTYYDGSEGPSDIAGCTDEDACNYDSDATIDDNSCEYANINFDCEGNCLIEEDCLGECGGNAVIDCNGVCDGGDEIDECREG